MRGRGSAVWAGAALIALALACSKDKAQTTKPAPSAVPDPSARPPAAGIEAPRRPLKKGTPASIAALKLPPGAAHVTTSKYPSTYWLMLPPSATVARDGLATSGAWLAIKGDGWTLGYKSHNPAGDDPPGCPTVEEMKRKVPDAKPVIDEAWSVDGPEGTGPITDFPANENALYLFERQGKYGFYATRVFDHGDSADTFCFAPGDPKTAPDVSTLVDRSQAEQMLATALSIVYRLDLSPAPAAAAHQTEKAQPVAAHTLKAAGPAPAQGHKAQAH